MGQALTRDELLGLLEQAIHDRGINVAAIKLRLEELRRDQAEEGGSEFDDLDDEPAGNVRHLRSA